MEYYRKKEYTAVLYPLLKANTTQKTRDLRTAITLFNYILVLGII